MGSRLEVRYPGRPVRPIIAVHSVTASKPGFVLASETWLTRIVRQVGCSIEVAPGAAVVLTETAPLAFRDQSAPKEQLPVMAIHAVRVSAY